MWRLGLLPLVKELRIHGGDYSSSSREPGFLEVYIIRPFFSLTSIQKLEIERLDIPVFTPCIQWFGVHFLPTLRSLTLREPKGSRRQIMYFVGLFQNLEDLELVYEIDGFLVDEVDDLTLTPPSTPPLRGRLRVKHFTRANVLKDMIDLVGGFRFGHMDLFDVGEVGLLLHACAKTLKSVVLDPTDPRGEWLPPEGMGVLTNYSAARYSLRDFDLTRNESLQTLQIPASSPDRTPNRLPDTFLKHVLSTITSPAFFQITILYRNSDFDGLRSWCSGQYHSCGLRQPYRELEASLHRWRFEVIREVRKVRNFRLVMCANVWGHHGRYPVRVLEEAVAEEKARKGFGDFPSDPLVMYDPQRSREDRCSPRGLHRTHSSL